MTATYRLDNGLTVILQESHSSPVVAFQAWVQVGSADEPEELAGIAHVFEHMLFKGTAKRGVGQIAQEIEGAGGEINAWTSFDETVYHLVIASRFFDTGLDIITDALRNSSFDPHELERELKVVLEEVKQGEDSPSRMATQQLFSTAFVKHPYRRPVIGYTSTVSKFRREQLLDFFHRYYVPSRITLVVSGDFDAREAKAKIAHLWSDATGAPSGSPSVERDPDRVEPPQAEPRTVVTLTDVREAQLAIAFHIPGMVSADTGALDVGSIVLGQGDSSRLNREIKRNRQLVSEVYAYAYTPKEPGLLVAGATLQPQTLDDAIDAILDELLRMAREEVSPEEIEKAKAIVESDSVYQKETVQGQARKLGFFQTTAGALGYEAEYHRQVREVTPRSLREVFARYLRPENCTISLLGPPSLAGDNPDHDAAARALEASLKTRLVEAWARAERRWGPPRVLGEPVVKDVLPSGTHVIVYRDPSVPLVAMRAVWTGGLRAEDERTNGINNLLAALVTRGTKTRTADEISHEVEGMAGAIGGFSGRNSFGVRAELLARHWERGLDILLDCLLHPAFTDEELDKERRLVLDELRAQEDNISAVTFRLFTQTLFPHHPYRMDLLGTPESIAHIGRETLADYYARHFDPSDMTIAIVGDIDPAAVIARLRATLERAGHGQHEERARPPVQPTLDEPPVEPRRVVKTLNKQQAHLVVGFPGTTLSSADRFPLEVLSTVLSGQGGRLFVELRDKRGLAYRVSAFSLEGIDPGYFAVYMATSPANLDVALAGIRDELNKVIDHPVPAEELERAKRYLVGAHDISLQRRSTLASSLAFNECYGLGWDEYRRYAKGLLAVTAEDVQRVARLYLDPRRAVVAIVKPDENAPPPIVRRHPVAEKRVRAKAHHRKPAHKHRRHHR